MGDAIQEALVAWVEHGDQSRGNEVLEAIANDWRPRVRFILSRPSREEVDDALHDAILALCMGQGGEPPKVLAPPHVGNPAGWRNRVLRNYLTDRYRRTHRRDHAVRAHGMGLPPSEEQAAWKRDKQRRARGEPPALQVVDTPVASPSSEGVERVELLAERHRVLAALPHLPIRRRVLVVLALGADPAPFLQELADTLGEPVEEVLARAEEARVAPHDASHDLLSTAMVRVVYPDKPLSKAREAARKAFERALSDLRARLGGDP